MFKENEVQAVGLVSLLVLTILLLQAAVEVETEMVVVVVLVDFAQQQGL
jgi:hypothetical protein